MFSKGVSNLNARWWDLKLLYQGIIPPIARDEKDFDPSSKYHVIADTPYIKYVCYQMKTIFFLSKDYSLSL